MSHNYTSIPFEADDKSSGKLYQSNYQYSYPMSEFYQYQYAGYGGYQSEPAAYGQYPDVSPAAPMPYLFSHLEPEGEPQRTASASSSASSSSINQLNSDSIDLAEAAEPQAGALQPAGSAAKPPVIYAWMKKVHVNSSKIN